jgi:hypothetical protein
VVTALSAGAAVVAAGEPPRFDGLWQGEIVYQPARMEFEVTLEIGPGVDGGLAGTVDVPMQRMEFYPLARIATDGPRIEATFVKVNEKPDGSYGEVEFIFRGALSADGRALAGEFKGWIIDGENRAPFRLERRGEAGDPRPPEERPPLTVLAPDAGELKAEFNRHPEAARLILLLSPT